MDRVEEIEDRLEEIEREKDAIADEANRVVREENLDSPPKELESEWDELESEEIRLTGERSKFLDAVAHWKTDLDVTRNPSSDEVEEAVEDVDECIFVTEELSYGQIQAVSDDMMEKSFEVDIDRQDLEGSPKQGYMQIELLREAIIDWPEGAPTRSSNRSEVPEPGDYPEPVSEWLFDRVDAFNTSGEAEMGNSSLTEAMNSRR